MKILIWLVLCVQLAGYVWLGWVNCFSDYDRHIPIPAMAAYAVAALNALLMILDGVLWWLSKARLAMLVLPIFAALPAVLIAVWFFLFE